MDGINSSEPARVAYVLIVEDDDDLRRLFRISLHLAEFDVGEAADAFTALHLIDQRPPDLVVLDLCLPVVSGHAVHQEMCAQPHLRHIPIVVVTGSTDRPDTMRVLRKPVAPDRLVDEVRACLAAAS